MEEKIVITKKYLIIDEYNSYVREYSNLHDLYQMLTLQFIVSKYSNINIVKRVNNRCIKVGTFHKGENDNNAVVICDKNMISFVKSILHELGYTYSRPEGHKNKQKILK